RVEREAMAGFVEAIDAMRGGEAQPAVDHHQVVLFRWQALRGAEALDPDGAPVARSLPVRRQAQANRAADPQAQPYMAVGVLPDRAYFLAHPGDAASVDPAATLVAQRADAVRVAHEHARGIARGEAQAERRGRERALAGVEQLPGRAVGERE